MVVVPVGEVVADVCAPRASESGRQRIGDSESGMGGGDGCGWLCG